MKKLNQPLGHSYRTSDLAGSSEKSSVPFPILVVFSLDVFQQPPVKSTDCGLLFSPCK